MADRLRSRTVPGAWLILPTYDEAENLERIVRMALPHLAATGLEHHVLVVDDGSPDGTGAIADRLARELDTVSVLHRTRREGLGRAYLAGFAQALAGGADLLLEMDADLSHDPADLARLIAATADADLAIGSRYVADGTIVGWGRGRRLLSRGGSWYAGKVLGTGVRDLTGGFKCFRRSAIEAIGLDRVRANGYAFQIELTYKALLAGCQVAELPITFRERDAGASKMTFGIALEAVWRVPALRLAAAAGRA